MTDMFQIDLFGQTAQENSKAYAIKNPRKGRSFNKVSGLCLKLERALGLKYTLTVKGLKYVSERVKGFCEASGGVGTDPTARSCMAFIALQFADRVIMKAGMYRDEDALFNESRDMLIAKLRLMDPRESPMLIAKEYAAIMIDYCRDNQMVSKDERNVIRRQQMRIERATKAVENGKFATVDEALAAQQHLIKDDFSKTCKGGVDVALEALAKANQEGRKVDAEALFEMSRKTASYRHLQDDAGGFDEEKALEHLFDVDYDADECFDGDDWAL